MTFTTIAVPLAVVALAAWIGLIAWRRRAGARRMNANRAMSGDTDILAPDYESTLAISIEAPAGVVWETLLGFGWPRKGRRSYEWLGRTFGFLEPYVAPGTAAPATASLPVGRRSQIAVRLLEPARALVLGRDGTGRQWTWQFELSVLDERRTRLLLRDRARVAATIPDWLFLATSRAFSFVLTRKMLLDVKTASEAAARRQAATTVLVG